jgi:hypothetical protein
MKLQSKLLLLFSFSFLMGCSGLNRLSEVERKSVRKSIARPIEVTDNFIWGINGHPITALDYTVGSILHQIELLKEHQLEYYRVDITTNDDGSVNTYPAKFDELLRLTTEKEIKILPVIKIDKQLADYSHTTEQAYSLGRKQANGFITKYGNSFDYYELGNEQENRILNKNANGMNVEDYDSQKFEVLVSYFKGMIDGIKTISPKAKIMITGGWLHWGYFEFLEQQKLDYDIISWHWYSNMGSMYKAKYGGGNMIDSLKTKFNKPIWITEINKKDGSLGETYEEQAYWVEYFMGELHKQPNINAFILYELYDEPNLYDQKWAGPGEASYGIVSFKTTPKEPHNIAYKPVSNTLKFKIEEIKHGYEDYVYMLYKDITGDYPDTTTLTSLTRELKEHQSKEALVEQLLLANQNRFQTIAYKNEEKEVITSKIQNSYTTLLKRAPQTNEINYWNKKLKQKNQDIDKTLLLSEEYWENAIWKGYERRTGYTKSVVE